MGDCHGVCTNRRLTDDHKQRCCRKNDAEARCLHIVPLCPRFPWCTAKKNQLYVVKHKRDDLEEVAADSCCLKGDPRDEEGGRLDKTPNVSIPLHTHTRQPHLRQLLGQDGGDASWFLCDRWNGRYQPGSKGQDDEGVLGVARGNQFQPPSGSANAALTTTSMMVNRVMRESSTPVFLGMPSNCASSGGEFSLPLPYEVLQKPPRTHDVE